MIEDLIRLLTNLPRFLFRTAGPICDKRVQKNQMFFSSIRLGFYYLIAVQYVTYNVCNVTSYLTKYNVCSKTEYSTIIEYVLATKMINNKFKKKIRFIVIYVFDTDMNMQKGRIMCKCFGNLSQLETRPLMIG